MPHGCVIVLIEQAFNGGETISFGRRGGISHFLQRPGWQHQHRSYRVACLASEQLPDWCLEVLAFDVPQCLIDSADPTPDGSASHRLRSIHKVPMMLSSEWVLPYQVGLKR